MITFSIYLTSYFKLTVHLTVLSYSNAGHAKFNYFNLLIKTLNSDLEKV